jgi:hypothetical protein
VLARHPETRRALVDYAQLTASPRAAVEKMYAELGFDVTPELARLLEAEQARAKTRETSHRYSLEEFGLAKDMLRERLAPLYAQFHWPSEVKETP